MSVWYYTAGLWSHPHEAQRLAAGIRSCAHKWQKERDRKQGAWKRWATCNITGRCSNGPNRVSLRLCLWLSNVMLALAQHRKRVYLVWCRNSVSYIFKLLIPVTYLFVVIKMMVSTVPCENNDIKSIVSCFNVILIVKVKTSAQSIVELMCHYCFFHLLPIKRGVLQKSGEIYLPGFCGSLSWRNICWIALLSKQD